MRLLVTGATGLVGSALCTRGVAAGHSVVGTVRDGGTLPEGVDAVPVNAAHPLGLEFDGPPVDAVVHAAALTDVAHCQAKAADAYRTNVWWTARIARWCQIEGIRMVHLSTHSVFGGRRGGATEEQVPEPRDVYQLTKAASEEVALARGATVVRIMPVGAHGHTRRASFGDWLVQSIVGNDTFLLYDDVFIAPTTPKFIAECLLDVLLEPPAESSILHLASRDVVSKAQIGSAVLKRVPDFGGTMETGSSPNRDSTSGGVHDWVSAEATESWIGRTMPSSAEVVDSLVGACLDGMES